MKFVAETFLVGGLEKSGTQRSMNLDGSADDLLRQSFMKKFGPCLCVSVVNHVCKTPTLNSATSGFSAAASKACVIASRVSMGSMILSIQRRAAP